MHHHHSFHFLLHRLLKCRPKSAGLHHHLHWLRQRPQVPLQAPGLVHHGTLPNHFSTCLHRCAVAKSLVKIYPYVDHHGVPSLLSLCLEHLFPQWKVRLLSFITSEPRGEGPPRMFTYECRTSGFLPMIRVEKPQRQPTSRKSSEGPLRHD